jgi:DNA-directed RNA polymerase specialized sigma24 family protein
MSPEVQAHLDLVESIAKRFRSRHPLAEFDDLVQEGLISVWLQLKDGADVEPDAVERHIRNYIRRLNSPARKGATVSYDDTLDPSHVQPYSQREQESRAGAGLDE